jgi:hypothetical protein
MPRARVENVVTDDGTLKTIKAEVKEREETKEAVYSIPSNPKAFQEFILGMTETPDLGGVYRTLFHDDPMDKEESPLALVYRLFASAVANKARADVYEALAQESTKIVVGKVSYDLMDTPLARFVGAYNGNLSNRSMKLGVLGYDKDGADKDAIEKAVDRSIGFGPWRSAKNKFLKDERIVENADGTIAAK